MKKIFFFLAIAASLISCDDDSAPTKNVSRVTNYPTVTINGDARIVLTQGDTYNEEGAIALAGDAELPVVTTGSVNTSTVGVYKVTYSAVNTDGFASSQTRVIIVLSSAPSAFNLEGTFYRSGNENNVVRISDREYTADNAGGIAPADATAIANTLFVTFYNLDDQRLYIPPQIASPTGLLVESSDGDIINNNNFTWVLSASGYYGTALRNFTR